MDPREAVARACLLGALLTAVPLTGPARAAVGGAPPEDAGETLSGAASSAEAITTTRWEALPPTPAFVPPIADTRAPYSSVLVRPDGIDTAVAARFPLVELDGGGVRAQLGVSAGLFMGFQPDGPLVFDFQTFDGLFAFPLDVEAGPWSARLAWAHLSAHYGDGVRDDGARPTNTDAYSREWIALTVARRVGPARFYAGGRALVHALPEAEPLAGQVGAEVEGPWRVAPYAAVDLQVATETGGLPELSAQLGARVVTGPWRLRVAAAARTGPDDTGKSRPAMERWVGVIFGFDADVGGDG
jgi:hypothetical protein